MEAALDIDGLRVVYGGAVQALDGISIRVEEGGFVAMLGSNGAGKSTTLKAISGTLRFENGRITAGTITFFGRRIGGVASYRLARQGLLYVREGRHVFGNMSVEENLEAATFALTGRSRGRRNRFEEIFAYFPFLKERRRSYAGLLSGGESTLR